MADEETTSVPTSAQQAVIAINNVAKKFEDGLATLNTGIIDVTRMPGLTGDVTSAAGTITTTITASAVNASKLATDAVETAKIKDLNVTAAKLATDAVETAKIKDLNVTAAKLATDAVETAKIKDLNVTSGKLAADAVTTAKILDANVTPAKLSQPVTRMTVWTISGSPTSNTWSSIPSWVSHIDIMCDSVSLSSTGDIFVRIGDSGGVENSGYVSGCTNSFAGSTSTTEFLVKLSNAAYLFSGLVTIDNLSGNIWVCTVNGSTGAATYVAVVGGGTKTLSGTLDRVEISATAANTFDSGSVNVRYW